VLSGEVVNAGSFRVRDSAAGQRPLDWYATITQGRLERLMPPWRNELSDAARWAAAMYTYTLHYDPAQIVRGRELYATHCAECHGISGLGDGERADELGGFTSDLTDLEAMLTLSDDNLYTVITEGQGEDMQGFADTLSEAERLDVVTYVRTLSLSNADAIAQQPLTPPAETAEVNAVSTNGTVRTQVTNGTAGGSVPANLPITLVYFDQSLQQTRLEATTDADGRVTFTDVPLSAAYRYAVALDYRERTFVSQLAVPDGIASSLEIPITVYELTEDPAVMTITGMVAQVNAIGDSLEITQVFTLRNGSDRAYTTTQTTPDGRFVSLVMALPPGAVVVGFPDGEERYVVTQDQYSILDTLPILPGDEHVVAVVYIIPYSNGAIIDQPVNYAFSGPVRVLVQPLTLQVQSQQLVPTGIETIGQSQSEWQGYGATLSLAAAESLRFDLSGEAQSAGTRGSQGVVTSNNLLPLIICGVVAEIALVAGLYAWYRQRKRRRAAGLSSPRRDRQLMDGLIRQIAELDAEFERGEMDPKVYENQRNTLKARLAELMK
jgi:mono/diheme cytochrome c family protein